MNKYTCGVPTINCNGTYVTFNHRLRGTTLDKVHHFPEEAFNCHARYLVNIKGYQRVGNREFQKDKNSPIRVLTKKSRFGGRLRQGKREEAAKRGKRELGESSGYGLIATY